MAVTITNQAPTLGRGGKSPAFSGLNGTPVDKLYTVALDSSYPDNGEDLSDIFNEFKEVVAYKVAPANTTSAPYVFEINDETTVVTLSSFGGTDSFKLIRGKVETAAFVRGTNATAAAIQTEIRDVWDDATLFVTGTTDAGPFTITSRDLKHQPVISMGAVSGCTGALSVSTPKLTVSSAFPGASEVQTLTLTDGPTGGTFTVTWNGQTTIANAYNVSGATLTTNMDNLSNLLPGDCVVTRAGSGTQASPYVFTFTFGGDLAGENVPAITAAGASLTNSTITMGTTTAGTGVKERQTLTLTAGAVSVNEVQTLTLTGGAAADTFKLTFNAHESSSAVTIPAGGFAFVTAALVKACLITISDWTTNSADITVTEGPGSTWVITFSGALAATDIGAITVSSPTGAAAGSVAETTKGVIVSSCTLTFNAHASSVISFGSGGYTTVTKAQIVTALSSISDWSALTVVGTDDTNALYDILVSGSTGGPFTIDFSKTLTGNIGAISVTNKLGTADGSVAETTQGVTGVSEVQTATLTDGATGGTYTITWSGQTTSALAYNASGATVTTALEALSNIRVGEVTSVRTGSGTQASPYVQTLTWRADSGDVAQPTASGTSLTGTTTTIATSTQGSEVTDASSLSGVSVKLLVTGYAY